MVKSRPQTWQWSLIGGIPRVLSRFEIRATVAASGSLCVWPWRRLPWFASPQDLCCLQHVLLWRSSAFWEVHWEWFHKSKTEDNMIWCRNCSQWRFSIYPWLFLLKFNIIEIPKIKSTMAPRSKMNSNVFLKDKLAMMDVSWYNCESRYARNVSLPSSLLHFQIDLRATSLLCTDIEPQNAAPVGMWLTTVSWCCGGVVGRSWFVAPPLLLADLAGRPR